MYISGTTKKKLKDFSRIIKHLKKSAPALRQFRESQKQLKLRDYMVLQNCKTRWNYDFYMLERLLVVKDAIVLTLPKLEKIDISFSNDD